MAQTKIHQYSVQEKLNKMDVDAITLQITSHGQACSNNEVIFQGDEIENAVAVKGGTCILQSVGLLDDDDHGGTIDLVFFDSNVELDDSDDGTAIDAADGTIPDSILGVVTISNYFDGVNWQYGHKENIGLVLKAASDSTSIYVAGVNRSGGALTWTASGIRLKLGVVKD
tara:strand:+ start:2338 stop:2847 length:510 start_codon:yes stop_codon:yes gene_type:complete